MSPTFHDTTIDGVLFAPFVTYALAALALLAIARPLLRLLAFDSVFANPPLATLSLYVIVLAGLIAII